MSSGLGKVERGILRVLREDGEPEEFKSLADRLVHDDDLARVGRPCQHSARCCDPYTDVHTRSEYESVRRACRSLERKGLVRLHWYAEVVDNYPIKCQQVVLTDAGIRRADSYGYRWRSNAEIFGESGPPPEVAALMGLRQ